MYTRVRNQRNCFEAFSTFSAHTHQSQQMDHAFLGGDNVSLNARLIQTPMLDNVMHALPPLPALYKVKYTCAHAYG